MAVPLQFAVFNTARELCTFTATSTTPVVNQIISITFDAASGKYCVFFT